MPRFFLAEGSASPSISSSSSPCASPDARGIKAGGGSTWSLDISKPAKHSSRSVDAVVSPPLAWAWTYFIRSTKDGSRSSIGIFLDFCQLDMSRCKLPAELLDLDLLRSKQLLLLVQGRSKLPDLRLELGALVLERKLL
eukprot:1023457-Amphidinium_carterae.1